MSAATVATREIRVWEGGWTPDGEIEVPGNYERLPAGDAFTTRTAKRLAWEEGGIVYVEMKYIKSRKCSKAVACWVPPGVIAEARRLEKESRERRQASQVRAAKARERRHETDLVGLAARLGELYPGLPEGERMEIVRHAFEVGSGRVGRTTQMALDERLRLALIAHARHCHTDYDERLAMGEDRDCLREELGWVVRWIVEDWKEARPEIE